MNRAWYHKFDLMIILSAFFQKEGKYLAVISRADCACAVCPWGVYLTHSEIQVVSFSKGAQTETLQPLHQTSEDSGRNHNSIHFNSSKLNNWAILKDQSSLWYKE